MEVVTDRRRGGNIVNVKIIHLKYCAELRIKKTNKDLECVS